MSQHTIQISMVRLWLDTDLPILSERKIPLEKPTNFWSANISVYWSVSRVKSVTLTIKPKHSYHHAKIRDHVIEFYITLPFEKRPDQAL